MTLSLAHLLFYFQSMSMRLTRSTSALGLFDFVDDDDVNALINHLDEEPQLISIRDEVRISGCRYAEYQLY